MKKVLILALLLAACPKVNTVFDAGSDNTPVDAGQSGEGEGEQSSLETTELQLRADKSCNDLKLMICTKVATCSLTPFRTCEAFLAQEKQCNPQEILKIDACFEDFSNIKCNEDAPKSCDF